MDLDFIIFMAVFTAYFVFDWLYAKYTLAIANLKAVSASILGMIIYVISAFGVLNYVENFLYIIPMVIGGGFGMFFAIQREKHKTANQPIKKHHLL